MKAKDLRTHESGHLLHELAEQQRHLFDLRTQAITEKLEDPSQLGKTRRTIARMKTILKQREIEAGKQAPAVAVAAAPVTTPVVTEPAAAEPTAK